MSVIIKGMEMPRGCNVCQLHDLCFDYYVCRAKKLESGGYLDVDNEVITGRRHDCCPLVEIFTQCEFEDEDYCIPQKLELESMDLTDKQRKMLKSAEKITILQNGKMRNLYD